VPSSLGIFKMAGVAMETVNIYQNPTISEFGHVDERSIYTNQFLTSKYS
jgi:hypothetical protein